MTLAHFPHIHEVFSQLSPVPMKCSTVSGTTQYGRLLFDIRHPSCTSASCDPTCNTLFYEIGRFACHTLHHFTKGVVRHVGVDSGLLFEPHVPSQH